MFHVKHEETGVEQAGAGKQSLADVPENVNEAKRKLTEAELLELMQEPPVVARDFFGDRFDLAEAYARSLATDGIVRGFIGPRELPRLWTRHVLNCAVIEEVFPRGKRVVDIGSGSGLPGIPLAIVRPDLHITLIEPLLKRSTYLKEITEKLGLDNVTVIRGRAEEKPVRKAAGNADIVTSRAVAPLGKLAHWSIPLLAKGGVMLALKGSSLEEEIERDQDLIRVAGGGQPRIVETGLDVLDEPTILVEIPRVR